jgi:ketosteroid isomerase-like protein
MKFRIMASGLLAAVALLGAAAAQSPQDTSTLVAIMSLEETWLQSEKTNNTELLAPMLADNIVETTTEGKLLSGKEAVIADAKAVKWSEAEYRNIQVAVHGTTAIVTAEFKGKGVDSAGKPLHVYEQFTDVWVQTGDKWLCVATHGTAIKVPTAHPDHPGKTK